MLRDRLVSALTLHFPKVPFVFGTAPDPVATLPSPCAEVGLLEIYDDDNEATVCLTEVTHSHFNPYDESLSDDEHEKRITEDVVDFLDALFSDQVLMFRTTNRSMGGWRRLDGAAESTRLDLSSGSTGLDLSADSPEYESGSECFLWSQPCRPGGDA